MNQLIFYDQALFRFINTGITNPFLDFFLPFMREPKNWIPLYVFLGVFLVFNFGKKGFYIILFGAFSILISDQLGSHLIKPLVHRLRPCYDPAMAGQVRLLLNSCGGKFSFPSSHALNHFTIALFLITVLPTTRMKWVKPFFITWAALISIAQVYVGVHFPIDIICGALLGVLIGIMVGRLAKDIFRIDLNLGLEES